MTSRRIDQILLALGAMLILFSSYQLFLKSTKSEDGLALGTLTSTFSVVKTKRESALDWRDAVSGNDVTNNQLIYTDNRSGAEVKFTEGSTLDIGESSLIKLKSIDNESSLDLSRGLIRTKLSGDKPLKVQMNGEDFTVSGDGADIQINLADKKGEIGVLSGEVKVEGKNVTENLTSDTALSLDGREVKKKTIYYKGLRPKKGDVFYTVKATSEIRLSWTPVENAKVLIDQNLSLDNPLTYEGEGEVQVNLTPGLYYYRVEGEKGTSLVEQFRIVQETAPELIRPLSGSEIDVMDTNSRLQLMWKNPTNEKYRLDWTDPKGYGHSLEVSGGGALIPVLYSGIHRWRLKIENEKRPDAVWTEWQDIKVNRITLPTVPEKLAPHDIEFQTYEAPNEVINFKWDSPHTVDFELVDPKGETFTDKVELNQKEMTATIAGSYRWRVRAIDNYQRTSDWSEWKTFVIEDLSTETSTEGIQRIQLKKPDQSVTFDWKNADGAVTVFELAKDPDFKTIVKKTETAKESIQVSVPEVGAYYWRSRQFLPNGTINVSEPKRVIIEPIPAPMKPEKLPDTVVPIQDLPKQTSILQKLFNLLISSAHADELRGEAYITLPAKEEAKAYVVRIYRDENLSDLAFETKISEKEFNWRHATPGTYYWQYAVIDYWDRQSLFSDPAVLTIKGELVALPVKPRLLSPIRAKKLSNKKLILEWRENPENVRYQVDVSSERSFDKTIKSENSKNTRLDLRKLKLEPGLYFWRVTAFDKKERSVKSNIGRFEILPPLEKRTIIDTPQTWTKKWKKRAAILWTPSMDTYSFKSNGEEGEISGTAMMGIGLTGTWFFEKGILSGEIIRQSGEVFEGESYLYQRLLLDYVYSWNLNPNHKVGVGIVVGQTSGVSYGINNSEVSGKSESSLSYGVMARDFYSINQTWELQGKLSYLTGDISQIDLGGDALYHMKSFYLSGGVNYSMRSYSTNSGEQSSLRIQLGVGREF